MADEAVAYGGLTHVALFYRGQADCLACMLAFARDGLANGEPVFIAVPGSRGPLLGAELGAQSRQVRFADMAELGRNPGRFIPAVRDFINSHPGRRVRFAGELVWPGRSAAETREAIRHEALINLALSGTGATVLCAYDAAGLAPAVLSGARFTHPATLEGGRPQATRGYAMEWGGGVRTSGARGGGVRTSRARGGGVRTSRARGGEAGTGGARGGGAGTSGALPPDWDRPLPAPPACAETLGYDTDLRPMRRLVASHARRTGLPGERADNLVLAASELAANTLCHTGAGGLLHVWHTEQEIVCQVQDEGWITDPLAGQRRRPADESGHGLWLVNQVCDLVELRTGQAGTTVRLHMRLG